MSNVRNFFVDPPLKVGISFDVKEGRAKQAHKAECDINFILRKYQKTGALTHVAKHGPNYGYATSLDFKAAADIVAGGKSIYAELPSSLRKRFPGPAEFLEFVQDPSNEGEMRELGLLPKEPPKEPPGDAKAVEATGGSGLPKAAEKGSEPV